MFLPTLIAVVAPAVAGQSERDAEAYRLHAELDRLSQKRAWSGVDRTYDRLVALKDVTIRTSAHLAGAQAAMERGDIRAAWDRAQRAAAAASGPEDLEKASSWIADFYVNYGEVSIECSVAFKDKLELVSRDASFNPVNRVVLEHVQQQLDADRTFVGYLPMGRYSVAGWEFEIIGGPLVKVFVKPGRAPQPSPQGVPDPSPADVPVAADRVVVLAARGGGWPADSWGTRSGAVRDALYGVEGVMAVDSFAPDEPWLLVDLDPERLAALAEPLEPGAVAQIVQRTLDLPPLVVHGNQVAALPGSTELDALRTAVVAGTPEVVRLADVGTIRSADAPPVAVPPDASEVARWRLEVRVSGATAGVLEQLVPAARAADGAEPLGLTLEVPPTP